MAVYVLYNISFHRNVCIYITAVSLGNEIKYFEKCKFNMPNPIFGGKNNIHGVTLYIVIEKKV